MRRTGLIRAAAIALVASLGVTAVSATAATAMTIQTWQAAVPTLESAITTAAAEARAAGLSGDAAQAYIAAALQTAVANLGLSPNDASVALSQALQNLVRSGQVQGTGSNAEAAYWAVIQVRDSIDGQGLGGAPAAGGGAAGGAPLGAPGSAGGGGGGGSDYRTGT